MAKDGRGWHKESARHALAAKGIKTRKSEIMIRDLSKVDTEQLRSLSEKVEEEWKEYVEAEKTKEFYAEEAKKIIHDEAVRTLRNIIRKRGPEWRIMVHEFVRELEDDMPLPGDEKAAFEELEWVLTQLNDTPERLLKERWGFAGPRK